MAAAIPSSSAGHTHTLNTLTAKLKTLINNDLRAICRHEGLPISGVKGVLQERIIKYLHQLANTNDAEGLTRMQHRLYNGGEASASSFTSPAPTYSNRPTLPPPTSHANMAPHYRPPNQPYKHNTIPKFRENPFYEVLDPVSQLVTLPVIQTNRSTITMSVRLPEDVCQKIRGGDRNLRVCLYSTMDPIMGPHGQNDIAFPQQIDVRVNSEEFRTNFKGLKNKPGSTRPADITTFLRKQSTYSNSVQITYALTSRKFLMVAMLVRKRPVESLVERIRKRGVISKERVLKEMRAKANDPDIVATSHVMSLKDPLSMGRIQLACRSTVCTHNQCFDAAGFLELQEQAPTWTCPICSKVTSFDGIVVDQYFQEILQNTSKSVEQVTIEPNGDWHVSGEQDSRDQKSNGNQTNNVAGDESDDDLIEITDQRTRQIKQEAPVTPFSLNTPSVGSREASVSTPVGHGISSRTQAGQKRKSEVIDLTLSDDDEPPRPNKRLETSYNTPNSLPDRRNGNGYQALQNSNLMRAPSTNGVSYPVFRPPSLTSLPGPQTQLSHAAGNGSSNISFSSPAIAPAVLNMSPSPFSPPPNRNPSFGNPGPFPAPQQQPLQSSQPMQDYSPADQQLPSLSRTYNLDPGPTYANTDMYLQPSMNDRASIERQQKMREFLMRSAENIGPNGR